LHVRSVGFQMLGLILEFLPIVVCLFAIGNRADATTLQSEKNTTKGIQRLGNSISMRSQKAERALAA